MRTAEERNALVMEILASGPKARKDIELAAGSSASGHRAIEDLKASGAVRQRADGLYEVTGGVSVDPVPLRARGGYPVTLGAVQVELGSLEEVAELARLAK
jgi:hypothetical protein